MSTALMNNQITIITATKEEEKAVVDDAASSNMTKIPTSASPAVGSRVIRLPERGTRVRLFYPTTQEAATAASVSSETDCYAPYNTDNRSSSSSSLSGIPSLLGKKSLLLRSGCILNAPLAIMRRETTTSEDGQPPPLRRLPPLLVYSHGYWLQYGYIDIFYLKRLASHNIIVAAVERTDGTTSPYTTTTLIRNDDVVSSQLNFLPNYMTERQQLARRASELLEAVEYIPIMFPGDDGATFSTSTVVLGGHGWGGPSAVMAANGASDCNPIDGILLHDPILGMGYGMLPPNKSFNRFPTITYTSDQFHYKKRVVYGTRTIHMKGCNHENFVDTLVWRKKRVRIVPPGIVDPVVVQEQLAGSMARFIHTNCNVDEDTIVGKNTNTKLFEVIR